MKSYSISRLGVCQVLSRSATASSLSFENRTAFVRTLTAPLSNKGNFKDPTPFEFHASQDEYLHGYYRSGFTGSPFSTEYTGRFGSSSVPLSGLQTTFDSNVYNSALQRMYEQMRGELDLSVDLLQYRQTQSMVSDGLKGLTSLRETVRAMRRSPTRVASNLWLQYVYGWKPLASSIYGTMKRFQEGPPQGFYRVVGTAKDRSTRSVSFNGIGDSLLPVKANEVRQVRCKVAANFSIKPSILQTMASLSSLNPFSIAWEVVPFSFVIDWVYDVGGWLRNMENAALYHSFLKGGYVTEGYLITGDSFVNARYSQSGLDRSADLKGKYRFSGKRRSVLSSIPLPRPPRAHIDLGSSRLLSAAALLRQQLR